MTPKQRLEIRASEIRARLAEIAGDDGDMTDEIRSELDSLRTEYRDVETKLTAAIVSEDNPEPEIRESEDVETREWTDLLSRSNMGDLVGAVLEHRSVDGAMREIQQEKGLESNQFPLEMLRDYDGWEERAATPAPSDVGQNQQAIIPYIFPQAAAAFLGVDMPTVGVGEAVFPVLVSELTVGTPGEGASQSESMGMFSADVLSPSRIQASFFYSREDRARFAGMDAALRQNLSDGLADGLDKQIIAGANGLLTGTNLSDNDASAVTTYANYISQFGYGRVDGRYASTTGQLRVVVGAGTYGHAGGVYRNNSVDRTALDRLMEITGGVRVSAHVPAVASNKQEGIVRLGMARDMVAPIWEGITLIPDEITKAAEGQIVLTAVMLHAVKILRAAGFYKQETQHA